MPADAGHPRGAEAPPACGTRAAFPGAVHAARFAAGCCPAGKDGLRPPLPEGVRNVSVTASPAVYPDLVLALFFNRKSSSPLNVNLLYPLREIQLVVKKHHTLSFFFLHLVCTKSVWQETLFMVRYKKGGDYPPISLNCVFSALNLPFSWGGHQGCAEPSE